MVDRKLMGCCTVCDAEIFEVASRYSEGLRIGEPKQLGRPLPGARRTTIIRASGRQSNWSICGDCQIDSLDIPRLNQKEIAAMVMERNLATNDTMAQATKREQMLRLFQFDIPLGVLCEKPWSEVR